MDNLLDLANFLASSVTVDLSAPGLIFPRTRRFNLVRSDTGAEAVREAGGLEAIMISPSSRSVGTGGTDGTEAGDEMGVLTENVDMDDEGGDEVGTEGMTGGPDGTGAIETGAWETDRTDAIGAVEAGTVETGTETGSWGADEETGGLERDKSQACLQSRAM